MNGNSVLKRADINAGVYQWGWYSVIETRLNPIFRMLIVKAVEGFVHENIPKIYIL